MASSEQDQLLRLANSRWPGLEAGDRAEVSAQPMDDGAVRVELTLHRGRRTAGTVTLRLESRGGGACISRLDWDVAEISDVRDFGRLRSHFAKQARSLGYASWEWLGMGAGGTG